MNPLLNSITPRKPRRLLTTFLVSCALIFGGCASPKRIQKATFVAPAIATSRAHVDDIRTTVSQSVVQSQRVHTAIQKADESAARLETAPEIQGNPGLGSTVSELRFRLGEAQKENDELTARLSSATKMIATLTEDLKEFDIKVQEQTILLNAYADRNNKLQAEKDSIVADRDRWRHMVMHWRLIAFGALSLVGLFVLWKFRGPVLFVARKFIGLPF